LINEHAEIATFTWCFLPGSQQATVWIGIGFGALCVTVLLAHRFSYTLNFMSSFAALTVPEGRQLLGLARKTLEHVVRQQPPPLLRETDLFEALFRPVACFVSLSCRDELRGCIGHLIAPCPLHEGVRENTRSAATTDSRFSPLLPVELEEARIEISVLSDLQPLGCDVPEALPSLLRPHEDGVVLHLGDRLTTFLPQVWNSIRDPVEFLDRLARKAGGDASSWRSSRARISKYQVEVFREPP
jgi:uncharacterized protein